MGVIGCMVCTINESVGAGDIRTVHSNIFVGVRG